MATSMFGMKKRKKHHEEDYETNQKTAPQKGFYERNPSQGKEHVKITPEGFSKHEGVTPKMEPHMKSRVSGHEEQREEDSYHTKHVPTGKKVKETTGSYVNTEADYGKESKHYKGVMHKTGVPEGNRIGMGNETTGSFTATNGPKHLRKKTAMETIKRKMKRY